MLLEAQSHADWLGSWFAEHCARQGVAEPSDERPLLNWFLHQDSELESPAPHNGMAPVNADEGSDADWKRLYERLAWRYSHMPAAEYPGKTSVSRLRQFANTEPAEAGELFPPKFAIDSASRRARSGTISSPKTSGIDIGSAHHRFLQFVDLHKTGGLHELRAEVDRMKREQILSADEIDLLDLKGLEEFWRSELGQRIRVQAPRVHRELPFAARFTSAELDEFAGSKTDATLADEFVVVQGVADLAVILPEQIWLIDFKTDDVKAADLPSRVAAYEPQLKLYARALSRIYGRRIGGCWLYFLSPAIAAQVEAGAPSSSTAPDAG
jgi:ATP-dependent helicase/nuclease subunit A